MLNDSASAHRHHSYFLLCRSSSECHSEAISGVALLLCCCLRYPNTSFILNVDVFGVWVRIMKRFSLLSRLNLHQWTEETQKRTRRYRHLEERRKRVSQVLRHIRLLLTFNVYFINKINSCIWNNTYIRLVMFSKPVLDNLLILDIRLSPTKAQHDTIKMYFFMVKLFYFCYCHCECITYDFNW